MYNVAGKAI